MIIECVYCKAEGKDGYMGQKEPLSSVDITGSICPEHHKKLIDEAKERERKRHEQGY